METIQLLLLLFICPPCLKAIQQNADNAGIVCCHLGHGCQLGVLPETTGESTKCCCSHSNALTDFCVKGQVVSDRGPQVIELLYHTWFVIVYSGDWWRLHTPGQNGGLFLAV